MRMSGEKIAPVWFKAFKAALMAAGQSSTAAYHAEDGVYYIFESAWNAAKPKVAYAVRQEKYSAGTAIGAWGGSSDYPDPAVRNDGHRTTPDPNDKRLDLCSNDFPGRNGAGCSTVARALNVAFNGDGNHKAADYVKNPPQDEDDDIACRRDGKPMYIRGRAVACPLNLKPKPTASGVASKGAPTGGAKVSFSAAHAA